MADRPAAEQDVDMLVAHALAIDDECDDEYWATISELQRRPNDETFRVAKALCEVGSEPSRVLGIHILSELGVVSGATYIEEGLPLVKRSTGERESVRVLRAALRALGRFRDPRALNDVAQYVSHPDAAVRFDVAVSLPHVASDGFEEPEAVAALLALMEDTDPAVRDWATFGLGVLMETDTPEIRDALLRRTDDEDGDAAGEALVGMARRKDPRCLNLIVKRLEDGDVGNLIVEAAEELADPGCLPALYTLRAEKWHEGDSRGGLLASAIEACEAPLGARHSSTLAPPHS
jgi:HEAT repeats